MYFNFTNIIGHFRGCFEIHLHPYPPMKHPLSEIELETYNLTNIYLVNYGHLSLPQKVVLANHSYVWVFVLHLSGKNFIYTFCTWNILDSYSFTYYTRSFVCYFSYVF